MIYNTSPDTILTILKKNKKGETESDVDYIRIRNAEFISDYGGMGYEYLARGIILNGAYDVLDSVKNNLGVAKFYKDGKIEGFKHSYFSIQTDFAAGPPFEGDYIFFQLEKDQYENSEDFVLLKQADTIKLYNTQETDIDGYSIVLSNIRYYLIKN